MPTAAVPRLVIEARPALDGVVPRGGAAEGDLEVPAMHGLALAKIRGEIVAVGYVTATFTIAETLLDERWPQNEETIREKTPVYLAKENSFEPDPSRMLTTEQVEKLRHLSHQYTNIIRNAPREDAAVPRKSHYNPPMPPPVRQPYPQQLDE